MLRILNAEPLDYADEARRILQEVGALTERSLTREELLACLAPYHVLIVRLGLQVDRVVLEAGTTLRAIVTATTGLDHVDVASAEACGIAVLSLRGQTDFLRTVPATAEHTWALLLALVRRVPWAFQDVLDGGWERDRFRGHDLAGKRLGLVGLGRIGEKVARYGAAFGMTVSAYDPYRRDWPPPAARCASLADLLRQTDVLSLHVPLCAETERLIGRRELAAPPAPIWLVNTSRGGVVDEAALLDALEQGQVRGAALDVLCGERAWDAERPHPLIAYAQAHDNLLITPHIGGATRESMALTEVFMAQQLRRWVEARLG